VVDVGDDAEVSYQARFHIIPMVTWAIFSYNADSAYQQQTCANKKRGCRETASL